MTLIKAVFAACGCIFIVCAGFSCASRTESSRAEYGYTCVSGFGWLMMLAAVVVFVGVCG